MLLDFLLSLMAGGAVTGAQSRCVPKPLRIALAAFMLTLGVFMLLCAIAINGGIAVRLVCGGLAALCLGYLVFFISRVWLSMR